MSKTFEVILTHEHTDFDALASLLGASLVFPGALPVLPRRLNRNVGRFVLEFGQHLPFIQPDDVPRGTVSRAILVDTNGANWVKGMDDETPQYIIDHHSRDVELPPQHEAWTADVGANTTMFVELLLERDVELSALQATLLALGIHEDTGSLTYASTSERDARCLAWLMEEDRQVDLGIISRFLHFPLSATQQELLNALQGQSEFVDIGPHTILIAQADAVDFQDEFSALASRMRDAYEVDAVFLLFQKKRMVQVVARSTTDQVDVGEIARVLGGDGHTRAAAAAVRHESRSEVRARLIEILRRSRFVAPVHMMAHAEVATEARMRVGHIMSRGQPQSLSPEMTVEEALKWMRRYGHEGFPVVRGAPDHIRDDERIPITSDTPPMTRADLMGLVTRRELDRAFDHGLLHKSVRRFMRTGQYVVHPEDSISELRRLMTESGWGQIPVVDADDQIIGIVTRTDLIRSGNQTVQPPYHAETVIKQLSKILSPWRQFLLRLLGQEAADMGYSAYVVGGFVRDILLNQASQQTAALDVDIVLEGDAIAFSRRIQQRYGGRMVTHKRFGTANWMLTDSTESLDLDALRAARAAFGRSDRPAGEGPDLSALELDAPSPDEFPSHLDFVTARTEFYTAPTALPTVERGSIKLDLYRRDFTINTLAVCLNPERWGQLLDFYGGLHDLERGIVRVLHSLSFVDDPTRVLRAVRYEQRFGFRIETRTLELLGDSLELLKRVTGARIRHEIERTLQEHEPEQALQRLDELGALAQIDEHLRVDKWTHQRFAALRHALGNGGQANPATPAEIRRALQETPIERLYWGILIFRTPAERDAALATRLGLRKETQRLVSGLRAAQQYLAELADAETPNSRKTEILERADPNALAVLYVACDDEAIQTVLHAYLTEWRHVVPALNGFDLQELGIPRGPRYRAILRALRAARLDGTVESRDDEVALALQLAQSPA